MQPLPHWYRWTLIVVATLILCACRAPFQDTGLISNLGSVPESTNADAEPVLPSIPLKAATDESVPSLIQPIIVPRRPAVTDEAAISLTVMELGDDGVLAETETETGRVREARPAKRRHVAQAAAELTVRAEHPVEQLPEIVLAEAKVPAAPRDIRSADELLGGVAEDSQPVEDEVQAALDADKSPRTPVVAAAVANGGKAISGGHVAVPSRVAASSHETLLQTAAVAVPVASTQGYPASSSCFSNEGPACATPQCVVPYQHGRQMMQFYPDEYLCDGGDARSSVVRARDGNLLGLDPEDTVAIYDLATGEAMVEASNRVCIYAPRFAAVRQVTSLYQNSQHHQPILAQRDLPPLTETGRLSTDNVEQRVSPSRHLVVQPAASFKARTLGVEASQGTALAELTKDLSAHENLRVMRVGVHKQSEKARLAEYATRAVSWAHDQAVQVILDEVVAETVVSRKGVGEIHAIGGGKGKLRIIKTASVEDALPGEEVEFTLRFDNVGFQPITNVTIVDNLVTRLEYEQGSQLCSFDAEFEEQANEVESLRLSWKIVETINPGKGGLIRFRCRIR